MHYKKLSSILGLDITECDASIALTENEVINLNQIYNENQLLVFRSQFLSPDKFLQFSRYFGQPTESLSKYKLPGFPLIGIMSNVIHHGKARGVVVKELLWHSDSYVRENPNKTTLLLCIEAPEDGGETFFVNTRIAYEMLTDKMKNHIKNKKIIYKDIDLTKPPVKHPIVRVNKMNGKKSLYVNTHNALGIEGMDDDEAMQLIRNLFEVCVQPRNIYTHHWQAGDLLVWDNPSTMHAPAAKPNSPRTLHRIIIEGDFPVS